jgi:hypothetical protein
LAGLEVDDQIKFGDLLHGEVVRTSSKGSPNNTTSIMQWARNLVGRIFDDYGNRMSRATTAGRRGQSYLLPELAIHLSISGTSRSTTCSRNLRSATKRSTDLRESGRTFSAM